MAATHILIADSNSLVVLGSEMVLEQRQDTQVSTASCASELFRMAKSFQPDIVIANDQLDPSLDTLALVDQIQRTVPNTRIMLIGAASDGLIIHDVLTVGVCAYLCAGDNLREVMLTAVETVLKGRPYLSPTANAEYLISMQTGQRNWKLDTEARSVLRLLVNGYTIGQIALQLKLPPRRVYWVRNKLRNRFGATTNEHLIHRAAEEGFGSLAY